MKHDELTRWTDGAGAGLVQAAQPAHDMLGPSDDALAAMLRRVEAGAALPTPHFDAAPVPLLSPLALKLGLVLGTLALGLGLASFAPPAPKEHPSPRPVPAAQVVAREPAPARQVMAPEPAVSPPRTAPRKRPRAATAAAPVAAPVEVSVAASPLEELVLLRRARRAIAVDPKAARELTREHATRFPEGSFREERELLAIEAALADGDRPDAEARAAVFRRAHPASLHLRRLDVLLTP